MNKSSLRLYFYLLAFLFSLSPLCLFSGVMEPDGALYATIAKTMIGRGDWINLYVRNTDWLDKPHLPFWLTALSFKIFGVNAFAYKLPSLIIGWLGIFFLYLFAKTFYNHRVAVIAAIISLSAFHFIISNFDVRAEIYLSTFTFASLYYYYKTYLSKWWYVILGSFFLACAVMTKGIFAIIPILAGFVLFWVFTKQYRELWKWKWWLAIFLIGLFIIPELYCLYCQFDLHPEKLVFGEQQVSGLGFFFWDSQFGRFFNTGPIKGKGDISFFLHTTLWAFLPWSILLYAAIIQGLRRFQLKKENSAMLIISISTVLTFLLFSFSKFQLPHYILIIFLPFSLITAAFIEKLTEKSALLWLNIQHGLILLIIFLLALIAFLFDADSIYIVIGGLLIGGGSLFLLFRSLDTKAKLICRSAGLSILFMLYSYLYFYPLLLAYQSGMSAGLWVKANYSDETVYALAPEAYSFAFYAPGEVQYLNEEEKLRALLRKTKGNLIFTSDEGLTRLKQYPIKLKVLKTFEHFHITKLKMAFLNYRTRSEALSHAYLIRVYAL